MGHRRSKDVDLDALIDALKSLSLEGRRSLIAWLRGRAMQAPPDDGHAMARLADLLEMMLQ
ncbi:MAG: hypothetical protein ACREKF_07760 [Candidatus Methylomirabilales bacterium]